MRSTLRSIPFVPVLALCATVALAQEREDGIFLYLETTRTGRYLVLEGNRKFVIPNEVWTRFRRSFSALKKGDPVEFTHKNRRVVGFGVDRDDGTSSAGFRIVDRFKAYEQKGEQVWLKLQSGRELLIHKSLLDNREQLQFLYSQLRRGDPIEVYTEKNQVVRLARAVAANKVDPVVAKLLKFTQRNDKIHLMLKREHTPQMYRVKQVQANRIVLVPRVPNTDPPEYKGRVEFDIQDVAEVINPAAQDRMRKAGGNAGGPGVIMGDAWAGVKKGDIIGIGFRRGQLLDLTPTDYRWRVWSSGIWGDEEKKPRNTVEKVLREVELSSRESIRLEGGKLEVIVNRSRTAETGGLKFRVELNHGVQPTILVDLKVKFLLGGMAMGSNDPVQASQTRTITMPMFANKREVLEHLVNNDKLFDGRVEVVVFPKNIVSIKSKDARDHIVKVIAKLEKPADLESVYEAAGINGDRKLCLLMIGRYMTTTDEDHQRALLKGLEASGDLAPTLILETLMGLDRHLELVKIVGSQLIETPVDLRAVLYKRGLIDLQSKLSRGLLGDFGIQLFQQVFLQREDLQDRVREAFKAQPELAVESLLSIVTKVDRSAGGGGLELANRAAKLLRELGAAVLPAIIKVLKKEGIENWREVQDVLDKTGSAADAINHGQNLLIAHYLKQQELDWERRVDLAGKKATDGEWNEALSILRGVLAKSPKHEAALELLPTILVNKGMAHRAEKDRGAAAVAFEEALELMSPGEKPKAAQPLAELMLQSISEDVEQVSIRTHPHMAAGLVRPARQGESFEATPDVRGWLKIKADQGETYVLKNTCTMAKEGRYKVSSAVTSYKDINEQVQRIKTLAPTLEQRANEVFGRLSAREAKEKYEEGNYQQALAHFEEAEKFAPTDPRLGLKFKCWLKANTGALVAVAGVVAFALGVTLLQLFSRPKKVAFEGDFRHYGADRTARERDLDVPTDPGGDDMEGLV